MKEAQILQMLSGAAKEAGIVYLHTSFQENYRFKVNDSGVAEAAIFIVMEYLAGATALDYVNDEITAGHYQLENVNDAGKKNLLRQMTKLLLYLHAHNFVHLDFTLENLMFRDSQVVAIDFGLGQYCAETFDVGIFSGKRIYLPPETYSTNPTYDGRKRDIWSLGVCCYTLYSGRYLINSDDRVEDICLLLKKGLNSFLQIHYPLGLSWPDQLKDFMSLCLNVNPHKRPSIEELLIHPWIKEKETSSSKFFSRVGKSIKNAVNNLLHTRNSIFVRSKKAAPTSATVTPIIYNRNMNEPNNTNTNNNTVIEQPPSLRKTILVNNNSPNQANRARISSFDDSPTASPGTKEFHRTIRNMKNVNGITVVNSPSQFNRVLQFAQKEGSNSPSPSHTPPSRTREVKIKRMSNSTTESDSVVSENSHSPGKPPAQPPSKQQQQQPKQEEPPPPSIPKEKPTTTITTEGENKTKTIDVNPSKDSKSELHTAIEHKPSVGSTVDLNSLISAHSNASKSKETEKSKTTQQPSANVKSEVVKDKEIVSNDKVKIDNEESPDSVIPVDPRKEKSKNIAEKVTPVNSKEKSTTNKK